MRNTRPGLHMRNIGDQRSKREFGTNSSPSVSVTMINEKNEQFSSGMNDQRREERESPHHTSHHFTSLHLTSLKRLQRRDSREGSRERSSRLID